MSKCTCPICRSNAARWSVMKGKGRVCLTCTAPGCGVQIFARSDDADEQIRRQFIVGGQDNERNEPAAEPAPVRTEQREGGLMSWA